MIKSIRLGWAGIVACVGARKGAFRVLVEKSERMRPLGRPRRRLKNNIKMDRREVGRESMDWISLAQDRDRRRAFVDAVMNPRFYKMRGIS